MITPLYLSCSNVHTGFSVTILKNKYFPLTEVTDFL